MESIIKYVVGEMRVIATAPATFAIALLVLTAAAWWLMDWKYSSVIAQRDGIIANKESEIVLYKGQRDDYKDKLSGATPDQAKARIDSLEARLARVEPRRLTLEQIKNMPAQLSSSRGNVTISMDMNCADCGQYGADFVRAFREAGWQTMEARVMGPSNRPSTGLALRIPDMSHPSAVSQPVVNTLKANNIRFDLQQGTTAPNPTKADVELLIVAP